MGILEDRIKNETFIKVPGLTDDIVMVVRCKDCKHGRLYAPNCVDCEYMELARDADWYCADGEKK